jgi:transposase
MYGAVDIASANTQCGPHSGNMPGMHSATATHPIDMAHLPAQAAALIAQLQQQVRTQAREIAYANAKLEKVNFELARLKLW